ncbi:MAG: HTH domain-containing protein [Bacteroidia bacterium]
MSWLIQHNHPITAGEISERLPMSSSMVRRKIKALKKGGKLRRVSSDKTGF